jgi:thioredoxin reductase
MTRRLAIVGAGPMGLEAALLAAERGFDVTVLEQGRVGESLRRWGARTRFFSPFGMNASARALRVLGPAAPAADELLTGPEMAQRVLEPIAASPVLHGRVRTGCRVLAIGRVRLTRRDLPNHPLRAERPFRLLVAGADGESTIEAECVLDASGVYDRPAHVGVGGLPARGERSLSTRLVRHLGALEAALPDLAGREVLVVGHGHSAAQALTMLEQAAPAPRITWVTRSGNRRPCVEIADDPLAERQRITGRANDLAADPPGFLTVERRAGIERLSAPNGRIEVDLGKGRGGVFDAVVGLTGYRPDLSFLSELAIEVSPVSEGALRLARSLAGVRDCLAVPALSDRDLESGEPGFSLVGAKSYGRLPTFLLQTGLAQLERVVDRMAGGA